MFKRPILIAAMILIMAVRFLYSVDSSLFFSDIPFEPFENLQAEGTVIRHDPHGEQEYLYLSHVRAGDDAEYGKAILIVPADQIQEMELKAGYTVAADCVYRPFEPAPNFGNFDEREYYASEGICFRAKARQIRVTGRNVRIFRQFLNELQDSLMHAVSQAVENEEAAGILTAICLGDRSALSEETRRIYQKSGIIHVLAISGLHISFLGMGLYRLLRRRLSFLPAALVSSFLMIAFSMMSGASASSVRALIMFEVQILGIGLGKRSDLLSSLSLAAILMLAYRPALILNSGFVLSFSAIAGIAVVYRSLCPWFGIDVQTGYRRKVTGEASVAEERSCRKWKKRFGRNLLMSFSVNLAVLGVTASVYYEIPLYAMFLNLLIIPLMSSVLVSGLLTAGLGLVRAAVGRFFAGAGVYTVFFIQWCGILSGYLPFSTIVTGHPEPLRLVIYYGCVLLTVGAVRIFGKRKRQCVRESGGSFLPKAACLCIIFFFLLLILSASKRPSMLRISFLDVGQGDGILIENPSGMVCLIDGGSTSMEQVGKYRMDGAIRYYGISRIDLAIITHPDTDHISGVMEIMEQMKDTEPAGDGSRKAMSGTGLTIGKLMLPSVPDNENYVQLCSLAQQKGVEVIDLHAGMRILEGDLIMTCLHPDDGFSSESVNGYSAVIDIQYGAFTALMTGDLEAEEETLLLHKLREESIGAARDKKNTPGGRQRRGYDLLKVAHHGSRFSSSAEFLDYVSPRFAVISAGARNIYGHPHEETLLRLRDENAQIYVTADCGEVIVETDIRGKMRIRTKKEFSG